MLRNRRATYQLRERPEKVGAVEAARILNVDAAEFRRLAQLRDFPRPAVENGDPKWFPEELETWDQTNRFKHSRIMRGGKT